MTCKNCNRELTEDSVFCPYCGSKVEQESVEHTTIMEIAPSVTADEATPPIPTKQKKQKKEKKQKGNQKSIAWILLIIFNCLAALSGIVISFYKVLDTIQEIHVAFWRCCNIDSQSKYAITTTEYVEIRASLNDLIILYWVAFAISVLFFIAVSFANAAICKKKLNVTRKSTKNLPWLCTLILAALLCGGIALSSLSRYEDQIQYYQRWAANEEAKLAEELAEKKAKEALQRKISNLLNSSIDPQTPYEVWEYTKRNPEAAENTLVKVKGSIYQQGNRMFLLGSTKYLVELYYASGVEKEPRMLDGDHVIIVGIPHDAQPANQRIILYIYDWQILG